MCPDWCDGTDHAKLDPDSPSRHVALIAESVRPSMTVTVEQTEVIGAGGLPLITVSKWDRVDSPLETMSLSATEARSLAAWLVRAADETEMNGSYHRR
jgi:DNA-binding transcriptional regulator/RsmH inhibitor MraZ